MTRPLRASAAALLALGLAACQTFSPAPASTGGEAAASFHLQDFDWSRRPGKASILGVLRYAADRARFGCQGRDVVLLPETAWSRERMLTLYGSAVSAALPVETVRARSQPPPAGYDMIVRRAPCDPADRFSFTDLPEGGWFVILAAAPSGGGSPVVVMRRVRTRVGRELVTVGEP